MRLSDDRNSISHSAKKYNTLQKSYFLPVFPRDFALFNRISFQFAFYRLVSTHTFPYFSTYRYTPFIEKIIQTTV